MKGIKILIVLAVIASLAFIGRTAQITISGQTIASTTTTKYVVDVRRIPYRFSFFTLLYGMRMFPGYVELRINDKFSREITSYSVNWDSFYPKDANITALTDDVVRVEMDGYVVTCELDGYGAKRKHEP